MIMTPCGRHLKRRLYREPVLRFIWRWDLIKGPHIEPDDEKVIEIDEQKPFESPSIEKDDQEAIWCPLHRKRWPGGHLRALASEKILGGHTGGPWCWIKMTKGPYWGALNHVVQWGGHFGRALLGRNQMTKVNIWGPRSRTKINKADVLRKEP